jgi:hypothetical protein
LSDRYEGLNLPQLLDLLHEPVMPEPVSMLPQTVGWQIVGAWAVFAALLIAIDARRKWVRNRYRREALVQLADIAKHEHDDEAPGKIALLLKRTALAAYPRARVAALWGDEWAAFLIESSKNDRRVRKAASELAAAAYRDHLDGGELIKPARRWIKVHRA